MAYFSINGYDSYSGCDIVVTASLPLKNKNGTENEDSIYFTLGSLQTLSVSTHQDKRPVRSLGNINAKDYVMGQRTIAGSLVFAVFDKHFADRIMKSVEVLIPDEIPAMDLTINFANEYGRSSRMAIYGVKLINEGQVMSINDLYTENTYQFVALGMEVLTADSDEEGHSKKKSLPTGGVITRADTIPEIIELPEFQESGGKIIGDKIRNNSDYYNKENINLYATIEQPIGEELTGIVSLTLSPVQHEGFIYITNLLTGEIDKTIAVNGSEVYYTELAIGYYNTRYMNTTRTRESNIEKIIIKKKQTVNANSIATRMAYPIIENVTHSSISVAMYNNSYTHIVCFASGQEEIVLPNNGRVITFSGLKSNMTYTIYATDNDIDSSSIKIKTYPDPNTYYDMFKNYITSNKNMLQNDYDTVIKKLDSLLTTDIDSGEKTWDYNNIVNGLNLLDNDVVKQELMLYGIQFENSILDAYNTTNPYKLNIVRNDLFDTDLYIDNWNMTKYYSNTRDNKIKLEGIITENNKFEGYPNKLYSLYGIDDNIGSIKKYVSIFNSEGKEYLSKYREIDKYKLLDISYNNAMYPSLTTEELYALTIRDNHLCDRLILDEPYLYVDNDVVYADVQYDDKILLDSVYYLCISNMYSTLDTIPCRKVSFNRQTKLIDLSEYFIPFESDKIYTAWIESSEGNVISKTFIFNYKQLLGLEEVLDKELMTALNMKKRLLIDKIPNGNNILSDIINDLYSESIPMKDLDTALEYKLLDYGVKSYYVDNALKEILYETILVNISSKLNINRSNQLVFYPMTDQFKINPGTDLSTKIMTKIYDINSESVTSKIYNTESCIDIEGDYMAVYLINEFVDKILGFAVFDCSNYSHKELGFEVKVGDR